MGLSDSRDNTAAKKQHVCTSQAPSVTTEPTSPISSATFPAASSSQSSLRTSPPRPQTLYDSGPLSSADCHRQIHNVTPLTETPTPRRSFPPLRPARVGLSKPATNSGKARQQQLCFSQTHTQTSQQISREPESAQTESNSTDAYYDGFFCWGDELEVYRDVATPDGGARAHVSSGSAQSAVKEQRSSHFRGHEQGTDTSGCAGSGVVVSKPSTPIVVISSDSEDDDSNLFAFDPRRESLSTAPSSVAQDDLFQFRTASSGTQAREFCLRETNVQTQRDVSHTAIVHPRVPQPEHGMSAPAAVLPHFLHSLRPHEERCRWLPPSPATTAFDLRRTTTNYSRSSERPSAAVRSSLSNFSRDTRSREARDADRAHRRRLAPPLTPVTATKRATTSMVRNTALSHFASRDMQTRPQHSKPVLSEITSTPSARRHADTSGSWRPPTSGGSRPHALRRNGVSREAREAAARRFNIRAVAQGAPPTLFSRASDQAFGGALGSGSSESGYAIRKLPPAVEVTVHDIGGSDGVRRRVTLFKPSGRTQW